MSYVPLDRGEEAVFLAGVTTGTAIPVRVMGVTATGYWVARLTEGGGVGGSFWVPEQKLTRELPLLAEVRRP